MSVICHVAECLTEVKSRRLLSSCIYDNTVRSKKKTNLDEDNNRNAEHDQTNSYFWKGKRHQTSFSINKNNYDFPLGNGVFW